MKDLEIHGFFEGKRVWRKNVYYRIIPTTFSIDSNKPLHINFDQLRIQPLVVFNKDTDLHNGWFPKAGVLKTGFDPKYSDFTDTTASLFLLLPQTESELSLDAKIKTEESYDFFKINIICDGKETIIQEKLSGNIPQQNYSYNLSQFKGKKVEIRFIFNSDNFTVDEGVSLDNIKISKRL